MMSMLKLDLLAYLYQMWLQKSLNIIEHVTKV